MEDNSKLEISTESYKGVRDFYPEELFQLNHIFNIWKKTAESFGYSEYGASILEDAELYKAKSGEEIVNEQTYTFKDRGEREVTLRPEMTPTVARMVAQKEKELTFPVRWYSVPNLFRYEKPQKGRLREHWQLNVDIFGIENSLADIEIIQITSKIMLNFGAKESDFIIKINDRRIIDELYNKFELSQENKYKLSKIIDKKNKISEDIFLSSIEEILGDKKDLFNSILNNNQKLIEFLGNTPNIDNLLKVIDELLNLNIKNIEFDPTLMRGFDYYTGIVFEVFDTNKENPRSIFGGGRYDDLLSIFGKRKIPGVGFGAGDVTMRDFLITHNLMPDYRTKTKIYLCTTKDEYKMYALDIAQKLREKNINVSIDFSSKKLGEQVKFADKMKIPYVICIGDDELKTGEFNLKNMNSGEEVKVNVSNIESMLK